VRSLALDGSGVFETTVAALLPHAFDAAQLADATRGAT
jgi:hypothetical protein